MLKLYQRIHMDTFSYFNTELPLTTNDLRISKSYLSNE